jgi:hypothetical protein
MTMRRNAIDSRAHEQENEMKGIRLSCNRQTILAEVVLVLSVAAVVGLVHLAGPSRPVLQLLFW